MAKSPKKKGKDGKQSEIPAPDGGWGWAVVAGYVLASVTNIPLMQNFGLIYKERFADLGMSSTEITSIMSLNTSIGQILGVFQAPILKKIGYRKFAVIGVLMMSLGTFTTGLCSTLTQFIITHGIISSIGFTYTLTSFSLAFNSYFHKRRSHAAGILSGFSGIGSIVMPQIVTLLLSTYGVMWTAFLLAALNTNGLVGASLLRPWKKVSLEMQRKKRRKEIGKQKEENIQLVIGENQEFIKRELSGDDEDEEEDNIELAHIRRLSIMNDSESMFGGESLAGYNSDRRGSSECSNRRRIRSVSGSDSADKMSRRQNTQLSLSRHDEEDDSISTPEVLKLSLDDDSDGLRMELNSSSEGNESLTAEDESFSKSTLKLQDYDDIGDTMKSTLNIIDDMYMMPPIMASVETLGGSYFEIPKAALKRRPTVIVNKISMETVESTEKGCCSRLGSYIAEQFDLDLLHDWTFLNIVAGLSIAIIGELLFSLLTPFILAEIGLNIQEIAVCMSVIAGSDIIARFSAPYIGLGIRRCIWGKKHNKNISRIMYTISLILLVVTRASLLAEAGKVLVIVNAIFIGFAKGLRTVFWMQVMPDHVPNHKLPSAMSFQNLINGILVFVAGPFAGAAVGINNSYLTIIYFSNVATAAAIIIWTVEGCYKWCKSRKNNKNLPQIEVDAP